MTHPVDARPVDSDRIDTGNRELWRRLVTALLAGALLGALVGFCYGVARPTSYSATTALSVLPDSTIAQDQGAGTDQDATSFVQSQLVVLNGDQLAGTVQRGLGLADPPDVSSAQIGQTYVVQVTAVAPDPSRATAVATATAAAYTSLRTGQLSASIDTRDAQIASQLNSVQQALAAAAPQGQDTTVTPVESALQTQYQALLADRSALQLERAQIARVVTVLTPASASPPAGLSATATATLVGALLGAIAGLVVMGIVRRAAPRIRTVGDLAALGVPLLLPVLPTRTRRAARGANPWRSNAGRLLAARLAGRGSARRSPVIVVGATPGVGTSHVAASLAAGMAERGPLLLVLASEFVHGSDARTMTALSATDVAAEGTDADLVDPIGNAVQCEIPGVWVLPCGGAVAAAAGPLPSQRIAMLTDILRRATSAGWQVVVDSPALSESDLAVDGAAGTGMAVLVVARGVSRPADVVSAADLFDAQGSRFVGAILNGVPGAIARRGATRSGERERLQVEFERPRGDVVERQRGRRRVPPTSVPPRLAAGLDQVDRVAAADGRRPGDGA